MIAGKLRTSATLAAAVVLVAACGSSAASSPPSATNPPASQDSGASTAPSPDAWQAIVDAAKAEGSVTIHSGNPEVLMATVKTAFEAAYPGITLNTIQVGSSELIAQTEAAQNGNIGPDTADVILTTVPSLMMGLDESGALVPLDVPEFESLKPVLEQYPLFQRSPNSLVAYAQPYYIVWNTDTVTTPIADYSDLLARASEFEGAFGSMGFTAASSNFFATLEQQMDGVDLAKQFAETGAVQGGEFLKQIGTQLKPRIYESGVPLTQAAASGEIKAGWFGLGPTIQQLEAEGAPIGYTLSKEAPTAATYTMGVPTWAPHPNAALVLADFIMSEAGQASFTGSGNQSIREGIAGAGGGPADIILLPNETLSSEFVAANLEHVEAALTGG